MARALSHINGNPILHVPCRPNPMPCKPMKITMSSNQSYWASINSDIDAHLKQAIPVKEPLTVYQPMHHLTFSSPQSTAPALCVAACELVGGHRYQSLPAASALHLIHAASFAHEHLPLRESARPNKPMIHHAHGPNIELLIGDAMIPFGLELLAESNDPAHNNSGRVLRVMVEITRATGSEGMICGQYHEVERYQSGNKALSKMEEIELISEKYEGSLNACAAACGAILGGGSEEEIEKMRKYGLYIGKIQGILKRARSHGKELSKLVKELRNLARQELKGFDEAKVAAIASSFE